jgi:hypothetical protein
MKVTSRAFFSFLTRVVQNGVPLGARMRNRVSRPFFRVFSDVTFNRQKKM